MSLSPWPPTLVVLTRQTR